MIQLHEDDALLLVDLQVDFLPGGRLPVAGGDAVLAPVKELVAKFHARHLPIVATRDWHPPDHESFVAAGGPWPAHCVAGTAGAAFAPGLDLPDDAAIVSKATDRQHDAYSAFAGTELQRRLRNWHIRRLVVAGLATDYCVLATVKDALGLGYRVVVPTDAVAAVDVVAGDGARALQAMRAAGAVLTQSAEVLA